MENPKTGRTMFTPREVATVLAALRYWQATVEDPKEQSPDYFEEDEPLSDEEIDTLCENINFDMTLAELACAECGRRVTREDEGLCAECTAKAEHETEGGR